MVLIIATTLVLCVLIGLLLIIPRWNLSGHTHKTRPSSNDLKESNRVIRRDEVCLHSKRTDCWLIITDKVYDVTSYVEEHPGGDAILTHAGDDATKGFYGPQHASRVFDMIDDFYIGDLEK